MTKVGKNSRNLNNYNQKGDDQGYWRTVQLMEFCMLFFRVKTVVQWLTDLNVKLKCENRAVQNSFSLYCHNRKLK